MFALWEGHLSLIVIEAAKPLFDVLVEGQQKKEQKGISAAVSQALNKANTEQTPARLTQVIAHHIWALNC